MNYGIGGIGHLVGTYFKAQLGPTLLRTIAPRGLIFSCPLLPPSKFQTKTRQVAKLPYEC